MRPRVRLSALAACLVFCFSAAPVQSVGADGTVPPSLPQAVPTISVSDLQTLIKSKKHFLLLDVREPDEFNAGHIHDAILMPLGTVSDNYKSLPKNGKIVVYCLRGGRSAQAVSFLRDQGFTNVVSLSGGYTAWSDAQPPVH